jgi:hypothetical protein
MRRVLLAGIAEEGSCTRPNLALVFVDILCG